MLFYLHYMLMTSGLSGTSVLLAVYFKTYTDASQSEIGALLMTFPFVCLIIKPLFCSMADRHQAHRRYFIAALFVEMIGYMPFVVIPFFPRFYEDYPRLAWYVLIVACHIGNGGLGVAWSLGDCLAVNYSQKTGTPFGRMRLMGTLSWGFYGFIIGQINEVPVLPKYLPAFIILHMSLVLEIAMSVLWDKSAFEMVDPLANVTGAKTPSKAAMACTPQSMNAGEMQATQPQMTYDHVDSLPSSLAGTLKLPPKTANVFRDVFATDELHHRLKGLESHSSNELDGAGGGGGGGGTNGAKGKLATGDLAGRMEEGESPVKLRNPQLVLLKMILLEDGRVIKYIILFTIFGLLIAPLNFLFLSMEELCRERDYNFSQLAGAVLISQALIETIAFLIVPWCMQYVSRTVALSAGLFIMSTRWLFYSGWYYTSDISPYWAVLSEWSHGIPYGIFCTIQADVSLMFANSSRLFMNELRKLGYMSQAETSSKERIEAEEKSIKMALRATIQALFGGFMDGLGQGAGALVCGVFIELYSYVFVWKIFGLITFTAIFLHLLVELTKSRWSDAHKPRAGTKAYEIMQLSRAYEADAGVKRNRRSSNGDVKKQPAKDATSPAAIGC